MSKDFKIIKVLLKTLYQNSNNGKKTFNSFDDIGELIKKLNTEKKILLEKKKQLSIFDHLFNKQISEFEKIMYYENKMRSQNNKNKDYQYILNFALSN